MHPWTSPRPAPMPPALTETSDGAPAYYVPIPRRLAEDLRDAPVAVGAFALIARIFRATRQPVPISAGDLQIFDPSLSDSAAARALLHLAKTSWVIVARRRGRKAIYTPTWGAVHNIPCPWDLQAPCLGRPRHIPTLRLDQRLLDVCIGRLDPHPDHPALARRYLTTPLLGLREVGAYALVLTGLPVTSHRLEHLHLIVNGQPHPVPDEATLLAIASQHDAHALTEDGWRRTPFDVIPAPQPADSGQAIFFVPSNQVGAMIGGRVGDIIGQAIEQDAASTVSGSRNEAIAAGAPGSHGVMNQKERDSTTDTSAPATENGGGGDTPLGHRTAGQGVPLQADAPSESAQLLIAAGVRRSVALSLAERPAAQVMRVISQARTRADVRDVAAWVVSALRDLPVADAPHEPERPLSALPIYQHPGLTDEQRDRWIYRFRAVTTPAEQRAMLTRLAQEHPQ